MASKKQDLINEKIKKFEKLLDLERKLLAILYELESSMATYVVGEEQIKLFIKFCNDCDHMEAERIHTEIL
ncbi:hypothetical protein KY290_021870 [Solanum tuberosum]|uniref:Uncharacterized protein n=1 Tax=Solanum tuberosum TaxID=4113 RepID=A0ABQ7V4T9_SOLTU|nr:hypothetical protein KY289_021033 [Solanum tuberosum]KAH0693688.1 hypothetical protein KY285_020785 [Solanum tuberosum]KAH0758377.1 hypothetical protein KY290_021870 [Solanum tuberosum]